MSEKVDSFEYKMKRLEDIVRAMERGDVALKDSLKLFREGTELIQSCSKLLDEAELEVKKVLPGSQGEPTEEIFTDEA